MSTSTDNFTLSLEDLNTEELTATPNMDTDTPTPPEAAPKTDSQTIQIERGSWLTATRDSTRDGESSGSAINCVGQDQTSDWKTSLTQAFGLGVLPPRQASSNNHWLVNPPPRQSANNRRQTQRGAAPRQRRTDRAQDQAADKLCDLMAQHSRIVISPPSDKHGLSIKNFGPDNLDELNQPGEESILLRLMQKHGEREPLTDQSLLIFYPESISDSLTQKMRKLIVQMIKETINVSIHSRKCVLKLMDKFELSIQILLHQFTRSRVLSEIDASIGAGHGYRITMTHAASKNAIKFFIKKRFDTASWATRIIREQFPTGGEHLNVHEVNMLDEAISLICDSLWYSMNINKLGDRS